MVIKIKDNFVYNIKIDIFAFDNIIIYFHCKYDESIYSILKNNYNKRIDNIYIFDTDNLENDFYGSIINDICIKYNCIHFKITNEYFEYLDNNDKFIKIREFKLKKLLY